MKIYMPLGADDPHKLPNPFTSTLTDEILKCHADFQFRYDAKFIWTKECEDYDIIHIMWPHLYSYDVKNVPFLESRLIELKRKGLRVIATCHNLHAHVVENEYSNKTYDIVYRLADTIVHLGEYSKRVLEQVYPSATHVIIPHHVYDTMYGVPKDHIQSLKELGLSKKYKYILCLGAFRNDIERELVVHIGKQLKKNNVRILAPSIMNLPYGARNPKHWIRPLLKRYKYMMNGIYTIGRYVNDDEITTFYGAADIALIQRPEILNSGNLQMGFYMGKVVVGPNVGNVGCILLETGNPVFDPSDINSMVYAVKDGLDLCALKQGENNRRYSLDKVTTHIIAEAHYRLYSRHESSFYYTCSQYGWSK